jgi:protease I
MKKLEGRKIAILVEDGFNKKETEKIKKTLDKDGAKTHLVSPRMGKVISWDLEDWDSKFNVDANLDYAEPSYYDGLILTGGVLSAEKLKSNEIAVLFVRYFLEHSKPVAAISHGTWLLTGFPLYIKNKKMTALPALKSDLENAGAILMNEPVVTDQNIVTCKDENDILVFFSAITMAFK